VVNNSSVAARAKANAVQNDGFWNRGVIRPIDIARARGPHVRKCDEGRRQHQSREDYSAEELHDDRVTKPPDRENLAADVPYDDVSLLRVCQRCLDARGTPS
jgi:hypothetical protein